VGPLEGPVRVIEASSPWADEVPAAAAFAPLILPAAQHVVSYHIVTRGACWAALEGKAPVRLTVGSVLVVPHGDPYVISSEPGLRGAGPADAVLAFFREMAAGSAPAVVREGGGGQDGAELVCGFLGCDRRPFNPVLDALPRLVRLPPPGASGDHVSHLVAFALAESRGRRAGARCVLLRLSEVLFVEVVRRYLDGLDAGQTGWLAGLRDPAVGRALGVLHDRSAHPWSLDALAREVGMSRSALAERFTRLVGQPPMRYLAQWKMQLAARLLAETDKSVAAVACASGYDSEAAFSRGFKRIVGTAPALWRQTARQP
jgi:AraC-like DNA-binding protein